MTLFESLMNKADKMEQKALLYRNKGLGAFYHNVALWYYSKAYSLTLENAEIKVI